MHNGIVTDPASHHLTSTLTNVEAHVCGNCLTNYRETIDSLFIQHPIVATDSSDYTCDRTEDDFGTHDFDVTVFPGGHFVLFEDYSGNEANVTRLIDRDITDTDVDYLSPVSEWNTLDSWHDTDANVCTHALDANGEIVMPKGFTESFVDDTTRNVVIENDTAFMSIQLMDEFLTRKHHARMLNVYRDKRTTELRVGGIRIVRLNDTLTGECVQGRCNGFISIDLTTADRDAMEQFVLAIIRHGNNHAASWFRSRPEFYKVHDNDCDLTCKDYEAHCNHNAPRPKALTDEEVVAFLMDHNDKCRDANCRCDEVLVDMVPALAYL